MPGLLHRVPLAALAAMLVVTGARLASPREFAHALDIGPDQLAVFSATAVVTLATDLLVGVGAGVALELALSLARGAWEQGLVRGAVSTELHDDRAVVRVRGAAVFTNLPRLTRAVTEAIARSPRVVVDFSAATLVDHTTLAVLEELRRETPPAACALEVMGLESLRASGPHPLAARARSLA